MNSVANRMFEVLDVLQNSSIDANVKSNIESWAKQQKVFPPGTLTSKEIMQEAPLLKILKKCTRAFKASAGMSHVLYAPSSTGKTVALRFFVEEVLKLANAKAIMISGNGANDDYLEYMAMVLRVREGREGRSEAEWIASMIAGLAPAINSRHNSVLVLDEFNFPGKDDANIVFADAFCRFVVGRKISVVFVTQNKKLASRLNGLNQWQKIGPLPHLSVPGRLLARGALPPDTYDWISMQWTTQELTQMILKRVEFKDVFNNDVDQDGCLSWLESVSTPHWAVEIATQKAAEKKEDMPAEYAFPTYS